MTFPQDDSDRGRAGDFGYGAGPGYTDYSARSDFGGGFTAGPAYQAGGFTDTRPGRPGPPSNVGWAVASIIFFWPLAFVAMTRALDVYPLWAAGRHAEAEAASATAKRLGLISLAIVAVLFVLYFVFILLMIGVAASAGS